MQKKMKQIEMIGLECAPKMNNELNIQDENKKDETLTLVFL